MAGAANCAGPGQQAAEFFFRGFGLEVLLVVRGRQRQRHLKPGVRVGQYLLCDQPVGPLGERRNHHESHPGCRRHGQKFDEPAQRLPDRRAEGVRVGEVAVAGDSDPEVEGNAPVTARRAGLPCWPHPVTVLRSDPA